MASGSQTDEYLSVYDLPHLLNVMSEISPGCIVSFGLQLGVMFSKIQDFQRRHNNAASDILTEILHEALNRHPPLTKGEIVEALRAPAVQQSRLANQIEANYIPQSQRGPQHMEAESIPVAQTVHLQQLSLQLVHPVPLHQTLEMPQTLTPSCPNTSQLFTSQQFTTEVPRLHQLQPNLDQVGQSHQLPASQRMSMAPPQPGPQMQHLSQCPPHHLDYQHLPLQNHPGYPFPLPNPPIHRLHESQSFPPYVPSHNQYSSLQPFHSHYSSVAQPPHDQYSQPFGTQSFTQLSHDQNIFQPSHYTPYQQDQGHQSHQFQWQSSSQPPSQHHYSPVFPSQYFHTSDTTLPQTQERQSSPAPTFAATSESTLFLVPSPSPRQQPSWLPRQQPSPSFRQQPSPLPRQQPSQLPRQQHSPSFRQQPSPLPRQQPFPLPRQQPSPSPRQQPIPVLSAGSPAPPPAKRLRHQSPSPPFHYPTASEARASTSAYPPLVYEFISFVRTTYSAQKVLKDEKWSLSPTVKFINLACIDRKSIKSREYSDVTKAMVMDGNVDAIEETKGPIKFSEIAKGISLPPSGSEQEDDRRLILVEGAPGVGKSTFAWEFCRKWMNGEIAQQYHLVLLLRLRDKRIRKAKCLKDLFFHPSVEVSAAVYQELLTSHKFHALIILEGYDELPDSCRNDPSSVFNELMSGKLLPLATVLVTSRPWATKDLHEQHACHIYQHIEVLGFTKKQIKEYINKNVGEEKVKSGLNSYLEKHPQIRSGMYIPLNSAIVVAVYKETIENDRQTLPNTITELYSCCIEILIRRHLKCNTGLQRGNIMNLPAINLRVPSDVHRNFVHMCHLAFSGIVEATEVKLIFSESELPEHFDNLGFMDSVTDLYVTGETVSSHNFLHLTFQEFFAAVHISTMYKEQQLQYFMEGKSDSGSKGGRLNVVLKFLAGLRKLDCVTKETVSHIIFPGHLRDVAVVNWLFEAQSETAMSLILGERKVEFKASKRHMLPMDYYSLGYCISHSQCQWVLQLESKVELTKERIKLLADGAREVTGEGKVVELGDKVLSRLNEDKLSLLFTEWKNILCIRRLIVKEIPTVWPDLSQLEELVVSFGDKATEEDLVTIANHLPFAPRLKNFTLKTRLDIGCITEALATGQLQQLERLDFDLHIITDNCIEFLITFLRNSSSLQHLSITSLTASPQKLLELLQIVDHHPILQEKSITGLGCSVSTEADVDVNILSQLHSKEFVSMRTDFIKYVGGLSDDGVVVLAEFLQHKYGSRELVLGNGGTSDDGTVSLAKALHHNSTIHTLRLWGNRISDKGAVALADALHHNSTLQSLSLSNNRITDEGAVALAEALRKNQSLQLLYLYDNDDIGDRATGKVVEALTQNSSINAVYLPARCREYATKCPNYNQVQTKLSFC